MVFGKQINRYYLKYAPWLILGLLALIAVDAFQMEIPKIYRMVINGIHDGYVIEDGFYYVFDAQFLLEKVCIPIFVIIVVLMSGRFLWRICFFGTGFKVERDLRSRLFDHCKDLSLQFYQKNKVGNLMSLYTNDLETLQDCFGGGSMEFFDAVFLGSLAIYNMARMNPVLMALSLIPMACMLTMSFVIGKYLTVKWNTRQEAFSDLSDFSQESFSGIAVIKAFVKEYKELLAFNRLNSQNENANVAYTKLSALLNVLNTLFIESVTCVILGYGGYLVYTGVFNAGQLMEFIGYFNALVWPFMAIAELIEMASKGKASLKKSLRPSRNSCRRKGLRKRRRNRERNPRRNRIPSSYLYLPGGRLRSSSRRFVQNRGGRKRRYHRQDRIGKNHRCRPPSPYLQRSRRYAFRGRKGREHHSHKVPQELRGLRPAG